MPKLIIAFILLGVIAGCGQKGPLYHSEPEPQAINKEPIKQEDKK